MSDKLTTLAATLIRGEFLGRLYIIAEKQKTVSCSVLERELDIVEEKLQKAAITIRDELSMTKKKDKA